MGGRNLWIAVPVGMVCAAVVGALVYLAAPMTPVVVAWTGDTLRQASTPRAAEPTRTPLLEGGLADCRGLYPNDLWAELVWTPDVLLSQSLMLRAADAGPLVDALSPSVIVSCAWTGDGGREVASTLARVGAADAVSVAEAALRGEGFTCATASDASLVCTRTSGDVVEDQVLRGDVWLWSVERAWHPLDYSARVAAHVWE
ncbi:hypothetical protein AB1K54_00905 [Microbacterium sp. BWT-B31]|uniref:hypothetical protein n=1 Tax=Microbacterium sp. BWT-B31 TaxID=3232072 RepID=UPI00352789EB